MPRQSATSTRRLKASDNRKEILRYKNLGFKNSEIADMVGVSRQYVHSIVKEEMEQNARETADYAEGLNGKRAEAMERMQFVTRKLLERIEAGVVEVTYDKNGKEVSRETLPDYNAIKLYREYERDMAEIGGYMAPKAVDLTNNGGKFDGGGVLLLPMNDDPKTWEAQAAEVLEAGEAAAAALEGGTNEAASG